MTSDSDRVEYLRSLPSVREGCQRVLALARNDALPSFKVDFDKVPSAADYVIGVIRQTYGDDLASVPFHSRCEVLTSRAGMSQATGQYIHSCVHCVLLLLQMASL